MELSRYYYTAYGLTIATDFALPLLPESAKTTADLVIRRKVLPVCPPLQPTKIYRAGLSAQFAQDEDGTCWLSWPQLMTFRAINGNELIVDTDRTDADLLMLFTLSEALGLILFQRGYFLLHGSAIELIHKGVVFLGQPGAGKSTTVAAFAQNGVPVLSDDMVCIDLSPGKQPMLIPAFAQIKLWETTVQGLQLDKTDLAPVREGVTKFSWHESVAFAEKAVPLDRIYVLETPDASYLQPKAVASSQVPVELLNHFPLPDSLLAGKTLKDYFEKSVQIAQTTPLFKLSRPADFTELYAFVNSLKIAL